MDARADIYSLAMTALYGVSGREPDVWVFSELEAVVRGLPVPAAVQDLLLQSLQQDREARPESMEAFREALEVKPGGSDEDDEVAAKGDEEYPAGGDGAAGGPVGGEVDDVSLPSWGTPSEYNILAAPNALKTPHWFSPHVWPAVLLTAAILVFTEVWLRDCQSAPRAWEGAFPGGWSVKTCVLMVSQDRRGQLRKKRRWSSQHLIHTERLPSPFASIRMIRWQSSSSL